MGMRTMKRDSAIELARIFGCLIVIGVHICLGPVVAETYDFSRVLISCFLADGVAIFWIISGCFYFKGLSYVNVIKKALKSIGIPMAIYSIFTFYFLGWAVHGESLVQSIHHTKEEYLNAIRTLLTWTDPVVQGSHLWYLYTYFLLVIIFPVLKSFVNWLDEVPQKRIKVFLIMSFLFLTMNDIVSNQLGEFSLHSVRALMPASVELIYGCYLYRHKDVFCKKRYLFISAILFGGANFVRAIIQTSRYYSDGSDNSILFWFSSIGVVCAMCVIVFCFAFNNYIKSTIVKEGICYVASYTFYIYLIHPWTIALFGKWGIIDNVTNILSRYVKDAIFDVCYTIVNILLVFMASFIGAVIFKYFVKLISGIGEWLFLKIKIVIVNDK